MYTAEFGFPIYLNENFDFILECAKLSGKISWGQVNNRTYYILTGDAKTRVVDIGTMGNNRNNVVIDLRSEEELNEFLNGVNFFFQGALPAFTLLSQLKPQIKEYKRFAFDVAHSIGKLLRLNVEMVTQGAVDFEFLLKQSAETVGVALINCNRWVRITLSQAEIDIILKDVLQELLLVKHQIRLGQVDPVVTGPYEPSKVNNEYVEKFIKT